jgi:hypothetical protein
MPRESLAYRKAQQEEVSQPVESASDEEDDAAVSMKSQRITRSSHGIVKSKRYQDVVDWSLRRSSAKGDKRLKCWTDSLKQETLEEVPMEVDVVKSISEPEEDGLGSATPLATSTACTEAQTSQTPPSKGHCATTSGQDHKNCRDGRKCKVVGNFSATRDTTEARQQVSLAMLIKEHVKVEAALKSFGDLLKEYQEGLHNEHQARRFYGSRKSMNCDRKKAALDEEQQATSQSIEEKRIEEEAAMTGQEEEMEGSLSPPPANELLVRASQDSSRTAK